VSEVEEKDKDFVSKDEVSLSEVKEKGKGLISKDKEKGLSV